MITYKILFILLSPIILVHLIWKSFQIGSLRYLKQRLGFGINHVPENAIWFHCASVGETNTVLPLLDELHQQNKQLQFIVTSNTATSASIIHKQNKPYIQHYYLPLDWGITCHRFIQKTKPVALFIIETELWPNLIAQVKKHQIKITIINARLSSKTTQTNAWMLSVYRQTLNNINYIYARTKQDHASYIELGADSNKIITTGNLKYALSTQSKNKQALTKRQYVIVASTHENEEFQIAQCWLTLQREELLVIAPRHPERKNKILEQLNNLTSEIVVRTDNTEITDNTKILILDTVGELVSWFVSAQAVVMGGSFASCGGHNVIEPAQLGKAILYGPHMENFEFESELLLNNNAALQVSDTNELANSLKLVLENDSTQSQLETNALAAVKPYETVLSSYVAIVQKHINI